MFIKYFYVAVISYLNTLLALVCCYIMYYFTEWHAADNLTESGNTCHVTRSYFLIIYKISLKHLFLIPSCTGNGQILVTTSWFGGTELWVIL